MSSKSTKKFVHGKDNGMLKSAAKAVAVDWRVHPDDHIFNFLISHPGFADEQSKIDYYFCDALKSSKQLAEIIEKHNPGTKRPVKLLEFASGYGCVSRHLKKLEQLSITSCDIHPEAIKFLKNALKVNAVLSSSQPEMLKLADDFDAVFALSFFSHMPIWTWARWLVRLIRSVKVDGLVIFTAHGAESASRIGINEINDFGYYFHAKSEQKDLPLEEYGVTITLPDFVRKTIKSIPQVTELEVREAYWWGHQDLYVLRKTADF